MWWLILAVSCVLAFVLFSCSLIPYRRSSNTNFEPEYIENIEPDYAMINEVLNRNVLNTDIGTDDAESMVSSVARLRTNDEEGYIKIKISYFQKRGAIRKSHDSDYARVKSIIGISSDGTETENEYSKVRRPPAPPIRNDSMSFFEVKDRKCLKSSL